MAAKLKIVGGSPTFTIAYCGQCRRRTKQEVIVQKLDQRWADTQCQECGTRQQPSTRSMRAPKPEGSIIERVTQFRTSDGTVHATEAGARRWNARKNFKNAMIQEFGSGEFTYDVGQLTDWLFANYQISPIKKEK